MRTRIAWVLAVCLIALMTASAPTAARASTDAAAAGPWTGTWAVSPQSGGASFNQQTLRQIVHTSIGGRSARVQISNVFGPQPLAVADVHVAQQSSGSSVVAGTDRVVTFGGQTSVSIPAGGLALSDSIAFAVSPLSDVAVSVYNAGASPLIANRTAIGPWEEFDLISNPDGSVSLRAHANGDIVTADNAGSSPLIADRTAVGPWESFDLLGDVGGTVSLRAHADGDIVTAENAGAAALIANRTAIGSWETFDLIQD